jgi:hypothetical protein
MTPPKWLERLMHHVCLTCISEIKGRTSGFSFRWAKPPENHTGVWLLQIAPSVVEISGGKDDGTTGFDYVDVDLMELPKCLDVIESFTYDGDYGDMPRLTLEGKKGKRPLVVEVYFEPFDDEEPTTIFDVNFGGWREKSLEED